MSGNVGPRLRPLPAAEWTEQERVLLRGRLERADHYLSGEPDAPPIPPILGLLARHPRVGGSWLAFSGTLMDRASLTERDRELLILRVGHRTGSRYLSLQHVNLGLAAGLTPQEVHALGGGSETHDWCDRDRTLIRAADELVDRHVLSDATWLGLSAAFDEQQLLELLFVIGSYVCLAMVLNSVGLETGTVELEADVDAEATESGAGTPEPKETKETMSIKGTEE
jgi:4-carboxymuconolactone decarboxylase